VRSRGGQAPLVLVALLSATTPMAACSRRGNAQERVGAKSYHAVGIVKAFGPGRAFVNIAHEDIAGYMKAMVMSFELHHPGQLDGLSPQDHVDFDFVETEDARRVLTRIDKRP
jgi:Cu(I)/Ag(I) efflux system protein CusF